MSATTSSTQQDVGRMVRIYDIVPSDSSLPNYFQVQEMLTCEILVGREVSKTSCPGWGSNSRPSDISECAGYSDYETDALPTALPRQWRPCCESNSIFLYHMLYNIPLVHSPSPNAVDDGEKGSLNSTNHSCWKGNSYVMSRRNVSSFITVYPVHLRKTDWTPIYWWTFNVMFMLQASQNKAIAGQQNLCGWSSDMVTPCWIQQRIISNQLGHLMVLWCNG